MRKKKNRFEKMELGTQDVPNKPFIGKKMLFSRKLELGNEAKGEAINQDIKRASKELDKQIEENERRRAIKRQNDMVKNIDKTRREDLQNLDLKVAIARDKAQKAKQRLWLLIAIGSLILLLMLSGSGFGSFGIRLVLALSVSVFSIWKYGR